MSLWTAALALFWNQGWWRHKIVLNGFKYLVWVEVFIWDLTGHFQVLFWIWIRTHCHFWIIEGLEYLLILIHKDVLLLGWVVLEFLDDSRSVHVLNLRIKSSWIIPIGFINLGWLLLRHISDCFTFRNQILRHIILLRHLVSIRLRLLSKGFITLRSTSLVGLRTLIIDRYLRLFLILQHRIIIICLVVLQTWVSIKLSFI